MSITSTNNQTNNAQNTMTSVHTTALARGSPSKSPNCVHTHDNDKITFGKYRGKTYSHVFTTDQKYVAWAIHKTSSPLNRFANYCNDMKNETMLIQTLELKDSLKEKYRQLKDIETKLDHEKKELQKQLSELDTERKLIETQQQELNAKKTTLNTALQVINEQLSSTNDIAKTLSQSSNSELLSVSQEPVSSEPTSTEPETSSSHSSQHIPSKPLNVKLWFSNRFD